MSPMNEQPIAILVIHGPGDMDDAQRTEVARWIEAYASLDEWRELARAILMTDGTIPACGHIECRGLKCLAKPAEGLRNQADSLRQEGHDYATGRYRARLFWKELE